MAGSRTQTGHSRMFHFTNSSPIILVTFRCICRENPMNPANLPFDSEAMLLGLRGWVECESPTWDAGAVERMLDLAAREMPIMGLFTPDEEVGTPSTRDIIEAEAARNKYVLVPEPGRPNNGVVTGRYAIARFNLEATGKPSHAGATLSSGRSAIREMARQIIAIDGMTSDDCTFSVGIVHGGQWVNCVATTCTGEALSMAKRQADLDRGVERMLALSGTANDVTFKVSRGVTRPVWEPNAGTMALYERARGVAKAMGVDLPHGSAGGGSDGNFTGAMGVPTLDGLGVRGADAHTLNEHIEVDSLAERGRLMAGLLATLD